MVNKFCRLQQRITLLLRIWHNHRRLEPPPYCIGRDKSKFKIQKCRQEQNLSPLSSSPPILCMSSSCALSFIRISNNKRLPHFGLPHTVDSEPPAVVSFNTNTLRSLFQAQNVGKYRTGPVYGVTDDHCYCLLCVVRCRRLTNTLSTGTRASTSTALCRSRFNTGLSLERCEPVLNRMYSTCLTATP